MQEIAQATFTYEQFPEVMGMLWKRMLGERKNWRRTYKVIICVLIFTSLNTNPFIISPSHYYCSII